MKIIKITESQYKKLVKTKNLNEQFETVYKDQSDKLDITVTIQEFINWLTDQIGVMYNKNLFIDKIQDGVVYIGWENYSEDEKNTIDSLINDWVKYTSDSNDELVFGNYFSGLDWDYEEDYKPKRLCWCNDTKNGEEIEYDCDETKPENCIELDVTDDETEEDGKKTVYTTKNGNLDLNDLTKIMNDVSGHDEYLSKEAAIQFNKMVVDALKDGITIKITDAYRPCGEPGDYKRYKKGARFTQWAAWEQYNYNPKKAAAIYTPKGKKCKSKRVWDKNGGGYCTSNLGLGNAIDVAGDINGKANQWIEENGEKYGWCLVEAKHTEGWHFTYCGSDAIDKSGHCSKCKKTKNK